MSNVQCHQRTNSGRLAKILMRAEDPGEEVFLVQYEGEANASKTLRHADSFVFDSSSPKLEAPAIVPSVGHVIINITGFNYDCDDGQIAELKQSIERIIDAPFTLSYNYTSTNDLEVEDTGDAEEDVAPKPKISSRVTETSVGGDILLDDHLQRIESETFQDIVNTMKAQSPEQHLLNPFGEPLTDADIQYAFDKCDENGDQRIQLKEFRKALSEMGLDLEADEVKKFFESVDTNGDRALDYEEFKSALTDMQPDYHGIWSHWLSKNSLDMAPDADTPSIEDIAKVLGNKKSPWTDRIAHMHAFANHAVQSMNQKKFDKIMRPIREPLILQLSDRRSAVVRECCIVIAKIALVQKKMMTRWAPRILESLFPVIRMNVEIMNISAHQAAKALVRCVPDDNKLSILKTLKAASNEKYNIVRQRSFQYVYLIVKDLRKNNAKKSKAFWETVMGMCIRGIQDASDVVRVEASYLTCELYVKNEKRTRKEVLSKLRKATQTKFFETLEEYKKQHDF